MSAGSEVTIAGRAFTLGATYVPRPRVGGRGLSRLLRYTPGSPPPGGRVTVALVSSGNERVMTGEDWAAWAGEEVAG